MQLLWVSLPHESLSLTFPLFHHRQPLINLVLHSVKRSSLLHEASGQPDAFDLDPACARLPYNYGSIDKQCPFTPELSLYAPMLA